MSNSSPMISFVGYVKSESIQLKIAKLSYDLHEEIRKCTENSTISKRLREELER